MYNVSVFGSSQSVAGEPVYEMAFDLGRRLAQRGHTVVNGGYGGLMEAVSAGAASSGGQIIGVTAPAVFPGRVGANRHISTELPAPDLVRRIAMMLEMSDAAIALPGSIGTLTELVMTWNLNFVARFSGGVPIPLITVGAPWSNLVPIMAEEMQTDGGLVQCVGSVDDAVALLDEHFRSNPGADR